MEPSTANCVTSNADDLGATAPDVPLSGPVNLESSVHFTPRLMDRRWSAPDECSTGSGSEASQMHCHSADVSSKQLPDWRTVESGVGNLQPTTHLVYSTVPSHASPQHSVFQVRWSVRCVCDRNVHLSMGVVAIELGLDQ